MKHIVIVSILVVLVTALTIVGLTALNLVPQLASEEGALVDRMFTIQIYLIAFFFSLIVVFMLYSIVVFRQKPGELEDGKFFKSNTPLEITWTVIPLAIVIGLGVLGARQLGVMTDPDADELVVEVTGFQFGWRFEYPEHDIVSSDLYLPLGRQVHFRLTSTDVIHSFWVPEFRIKQDAVPGRWTTLRVTPTEIGDYRLLCAELCGYSHTSMIAPVVVVDESGFDSWLAGQEPAVEPSDDMSPIELGARVAELQGCMGCHTMDGADLVGPTWLGLFGTERTLEDGSTVMVDEEYLRKAIMDPNSQVAAGYPQIMPVYETVLTDEEIEGLVEYIKSVHR